MTASGITTADIRTRAIKYDFLIKRLSPLYYTKDFLNGFSNTYEATGVGSALCLYGADFENFNNLDLLQLAYTPEELFSFLTLDNAREIFELLSPADCGKFFITLRNKYFELWSKKCIERGIRITDDIEPSHEIIVEFLTWARIGNTELVQIFHELRKNIYSYPTTPIEILSELL